MIFKRDIISFMLLHDEAVIKVHTSNPGECAPIAQFTSEIFEMDVSPQNEQRNSVDRWI